MLRRVTSSLLSSASRRRLSTEVPATPAADLNFMEAWKKVSPNLEPPKTPLSFMKARPPTPSALPSTHRQLRPPLRFPIVRKRGHLLLLLQISGGFCFGLFVTAFCTC
ncbi:unnamed protein product [Sphenostylis stenocarpa]|uniref:Uncharacterized protein n=1 Tax=Sphenostylis stenocarpa TaxID=92480 RepID=A0AA86S9X4_9FABA|nr:unnamed protein product [Sphenostylis stenocarpa]